MISVPARQMFASSRTTETMGSILKKAKYTDSYISFIDIYNVDRSNTRGGVKENRH
jgi:hypothetical protein